MDKAFGKASLVIVILENGNIPRLMAMVCISGKMVIAMKASGQIVSSMVREPMYLLTVIRILVNTKMVYLMDMDSISGKMEVFTKVSLKKV